MKNLAVVFVLLFFYTQRSVPEWTSDWLTSPFDYHRCNRSEDVKVIYICNPDGLLTEIEAQNLERDIENIKSETNSSCSEAGAVPRGYTIRALILTIYNETLLPMPRDYNLKHSERMKSFAKFLHKSLRPDPIICDDGIFVLVSVQDKKIEPVAGEAVRSALNEEKQKAIDKEAVNFLAKGKVKEAVQFLIDEYGLVLRGGKSSVLDEGDKTLIISAVVAVVLIITLLVLALLIFRWLRGLKPHECVDGTATTTDVQCNSEKSEDIEPSESVKL